MHKTAAVLKQLSHPMAVWATTMHQAAAPIASLGERDVVYPLPPNKGSGPTMGLLVFDSVLAI